MFSNPIKGQFMTTYNKAGISNWQASLGLAALLVAGFYLAAYLVYIAVYIVTFLMLLLIEIAYGLLDHNMEHRKSINEGEEYLDVRR
jgi:hypothetical protein